MTIIEQNAAHALVAIPGKLEELDKTLRTLTAAVFALHVSVTKIPARELAPLVKRAYDDLRDAMKQ